MSKDFGYTGLFNSNANCTYTAGNGAKTKLSIETLLALMEQIPEEPKIMVMEIGIFKNPLLPENWIMLSPSVAEALEEAMKSKEGSVKHE